MIVTSLIALHDLFCDFTFSFRTSQLEVSSSLARLYFKALLAVVLLGFRIIKKVQSSIIAGVAVSRRVFLHFARRFWDSTSKF